MDLSPRAVIAGRYRVDTKVGAGGMGEVWLGQSTADGARVAVKTLLPAAAMNHEVVARFKREAYILGRIRSENVARVVDFVADDLYGLVLVMEFVEGDPLSRLLQERTLTVEEGIDLAYGLAGALKDLHAANIIHRDLKPGNIMMTPMQDGRRRAVVVDFGVSRVMSEKDKDEDEELTGITRADMAVGTIEYMAPEQILNSRNVTPGSDLYAAGAMLFRSCAGRHVFGNVASDAELAQKKLTTESPPLPLSRTDALAEGFAKVVARMVKRRPSERYKTADEVIADLTPLLPSAKGDGAGAEVHDLPTLDGVGGPAAAASAAVARSANGAAEPTPGPSGPASAAPISAAPISAGSSGAPASSPAPSSPAPSSSDSRISVTTGPANDGAAPARRGVPPAVTIGLVVAALAGGILIGPRLAQQPAVAPPAPTPTTAPPTPAATAITTAVEPAPATAAASATAAPEAAPTASATSAASAAATASAATMGDAGAARPTPGRVPGPMPRSSLISPLIPLPPLAPPPPPRVEPTQL